MLHAFPMTSLNYDLSVSPSSIFEKEKSLLTKKKKMQTKASNFYHVSWPISAMDRIDPSFCVLELITIEFYKLSFGPETE